MQTTPAHPGMIMMTSSNGNISRVTGPLCGEFTGPGEFPSQRPVTRSFVVFFDLRLNKRLSKQLWGWWFEKQSRSLWRHCNDANVGVMSTCDTWNSCFCDDHIVLATWYLLLIINMVLDRETLFLSTLQGDLISNDKNALIGYHLIFSVRIVTNICDVNWGEKFTLWTAQTNPFWVLVEQYSYPSHFNKSIFLRNNRRFWYRKCWIHKFGSKYDALSFELHWGPHTFYPFYWNTSTGNTAIFVYKVQN